MIVKPSLQLTDDPALLITDDDDDFREALAELFARRGFRIRLARDGEEALDVLRQTTIHLAVLDIHMPRLTGIETLRQVRASSSDLPCILISADLNAELCEQARQVAAFSVVAKPVNSRQITAIVHDALRQSYDWTPTS
ncbi:MAG: response regulator [Planctomycetes bacterium]|nr:response regulator [Planctomycetota bacterium]